MMCRRDKYWWGIGLKIGERMVGIIIFDHWCRIKMTKKMPMGRRSEKVVRERLGNQKNAH